MSLDQAQQVAFFEQEIRPALIEHCHDCHSVESEASGGLLLDSLDGWMRGGDSGKAIEPGSPDASLLVTAISYDDPDLQMPPDGIMPKETIAAFSKWIKQGAVDPRKGQAEIQHKQTGLPVERAHEHWAYRPVQIQTPSRLQRRSASASSSNATRTSITSVIDHFIESQLDDMGLEFAGQANDQILIRRLHLDLTGLPPTAAQVLRYVDSNDPHKYETLVDKLLASPRFGEHFARNWMDVARYGESITLRGFVLPQAWRYRDYLIRSFTADRPFDAMIREQLAGDLLDNTSENAQPESLLQHQDRLIATAFLTMGNTNLEKQDKAQLEMDYVDEQLEVIGRAFLGQTIGCARCHDHKFDPIPTRDYYALAGIFSSTNAMEHENVSKWIEKPLPLNAHEEERFIGLSEQLATAKSKLKLAKRKLAAIDKEIASSKAGGIVLDDSAAELNGKWRASTFVPKYVGTNYLVSESGGDAVFKVQKLEPGDYEIRIAYSPGKNRSSDTLVEVFAEDGKQKFKLNQRKTPAGQGLWHSLGVFKYEQTQPRIRISGESTTGAVIVDAVQLLRTDENKLAAAHETRVSTAALANTKREQQRKQFAADINSIEQDISVIQKSLAERPAFLTLVEKDEPRDIAIHVRGDVHNLGEVVPRGILTAVKPEFGPIEKSGRREFAEWVTAPENPLTARVYANRVWLWLMGQGIVGSPNNFGTTGLAPSHGELLDWLATELQENNWSTKSLAKKIVLSKAYQRTSDFNNAVAVKHDPENRLYWRGHRRRLSAEAIRDSMLLVSGELDLQQEGSTLRPGTKADYNYTHQGTRRSIYQPVLRNSLPELYEVFDFADSSVSVGQRPRSTVATQALVLMNHPWVSSRAKAAAEQLVERFDLADKNWNEAKLGEVVTHVYISAVGRNPTLAEMKISLGFLSMTDGKLSARQERLQQWIHSVFASVDFRYID